MTVKQHPLTFGIEGYSDILAGEYRPNIGSIYAYDNAIPLGEQFNLSVGVEAQEHTDYYGQINPHVALWGGIDDRTRFKASVDRKMKPFNFTEHYLKNNFAQIEEEQLNPEREWLYQAEVSYQLLESLELQLKLRETETFDYIAWDQDWASDQRDYTDIDKNSDSEKDLKRNTDTLWEPVNIEHAIFRGGQGGLVWDIHKDWQYQANVGYIQANNLKEKKVIPYYPEFRVNESIRYQGLFNAFVEAKYFGRYYYDKDVYDRVLSDYTLVNARVDKEFWERITFFVDGRNLVGVQHDIVKGYPSEPARVDGGITVRF